MQQILMIPCTFPDPENEHERVKGHFHLWGMQSQFVLGGKETVMENTVGVVEDENGQIHLVMPEGIIMNRKIKA